MSVFDYFEHYNEHSQPEIASALEDALPQLTMAFKASGGEFPSSTKTANAIRVVLGDRDPNVNTLVNAICNDPVLAARLVSLVNYPAYARAGRPSRNVTAALNQLGFMRMKEAMADLPAEKDYQRVFAGRAIALDVFARSLMVAQLAKRFVVLMAPKRKIVEETIIAAVLAEFPLTAMSYFKPQIYASCRISALKISDDIDRVFKKVCKISQSEIAAQTVSAMSLPKEYGTMMDYLGNPPWNRRVWTTEEREEIKPIVCSVYFARAIAHEIFYFREAETFRILLREYSSKLDLNLDAVFSLVSEVPDALRESLDMVGIRNIPLPSFLMELNQKNQIVEEGNKVKVRQIQNPKDQLSNYLLEIRAALKTEKVETEYGRAPQVVYCTLMALVKVLGFSRAIFLSRSSDKAGLKLSASFGVPHVQYETLMRRFSSREKQYMPDLSSYNDRKASFTGDPIFDDDWPFAAFPVIQGGEAVGIFYADRASNPNAQALSTEEQMSVIALAEEWQQVPETFV